MAQDGQDKRQDEARWRQDAKNGARPERFHPPGGGTTPFGPPTAWRARALGRGWGGVNPPQGLEEIGLEWYEVAQAAYLHALKLSASADIIINCDVHVLRIATYYVLA